MSKTGKMNGFGNAFTAKKLFPVRVSRRSSHQDSGFRLRIADIISRKRDGESLSIEEVEFFVEGITSGTIQEAQLGEIYTLYTCINTFRID